MDWQLNLLFLLWVLVPFAYAWNPIPSTHGRSFYTSARQPKEQPTPQRHFQRQQRNAISPYLDLALCPLRQQPWTCARERSARLLDIWDGELHVQWQKLKDEADRQLNATLEKRGYSDTTTLSKEKPSTILKKIEIGSNYMKKYLAETMDGFLGREYEYLDNTKDNDLNDEETADEDYNEDEDDNDEEAENEEDEEDAEEEENEQTDDLKSTNEITEDANNLTHENQDNDVEFVELPPDGNNANNEEEDEDGVDELKKPGGGNKRRKKNKKKKGSQHEVATQAANLLVIQPLEHQLAAQHHDDQFETTQLLKPLKQKRKPLKQKNRKRKKGGHGGETATIVVEQEPATDHLGLGLLEELAEWDGDVGGKRKKKYPMKYGRSNGVMRGKKKKKKKAIMKLMVLGSFLKAKIELLLKLLGAHLQIKFFAVALIGLLINIARFWIDLKRGGQPQKVVYVEHAHHQHHYDDHGEDWSESGGGYWKRSLQTDSTENTYDSVTDSYQPRQPHHLQLQQQQQQQELQQYHYDPQYMAYRNQWQRK